MVSYKKKRWLVIVTHITLSHPQVSNHKKMAHPMIFSLPSLILLHQASTSQSYYKPKAQAFLHPIYKDKTTNLYSLPLTIGSNLHSQNFLIDLNGAAPLLLNCTAASTSYHSIRFANPDSSCPKNTTNKPLCRKYVSTSFTDRPVNARLL